VSCCSCLCPACVLLCPAVSRCVRYVPLSLRMRFRNRSAYFDGGANRSAIAETFSAVRTGLNRHPNGNYVYRISPETVKVHLQGNCGWRRDAMSFSISPSKKSGNSLTRGLCLCRPTQSETALLRSRFRCRSKTGINQHGERTSLRLQSTLAEKKKSATPRPARQQ